MIATCVVSFVSIFLIQKTLSVLPLHLTQDQFYGYSGTLGIGVGAVFIAFMSYKRGWCKDLNERKFKLDHRAILICLLAVSAVQVILNSVLGLAFHKIHPLVPQVNPDNTALDYIFTIVGAPLTEEFMFRYGIYGAMRHSFNKTFSMIITAVLFTLAHGFQLQGFFLCLAVGFILALVFEKTGNIWYSISIHAALNTYVSISNYLVNRGIPLFSEKNGYVICHSITIAVAAVIALISVLILRRKGRKDSVQSPGC